MKGMSGSPNYDLVCKAIGRRLFKNKSEEYIAVEKARMEEWIKELEAESQAEVREDMKKMEKEDEKKPWYAGGMNKTRTEILYFHAFGKSTRSICRVFRRGQCEGQEVGTLANGVLHRRESLNLLRCPTRSLTIFRVLQLREGGYCMFIIS
jgi:hypothetical protein